MNNYPIWLGIVNQGKVASSKIILHTCKNPLSSQSICERYAKSNSYSDYSDKELANRFKFNLYLN